MKKIVYINDSRRPERNDEFKKIIEHADFTDHFIFVDDVKTLANMSNIAGVICHSGMSGYNIVTYFQKINTWPLLSYSGSVSSTPYLRPNKHTKNQFSVDSDYFEIILPEFIDICMK